jgi:hypothetical protein
MKEIILHHDRNREAFLKVFPNAEFLGFGFGYWEPTYKLSDREWQRNKNRLPKSCTIDEVKTTK